MTVRYDMLSEIAVRLIFQCEKRFSEHRPAENVNSHRCKVAARILRLLFKLLDLPAVIRNHDSETARLFHRNRHRRDGNIRFVRLVVIQHHFIIHLVDMVARQNQHIIRIIRLHIIHILIDRIRRSRIPLAV